MPRQTEGQLSFGDASGQSGRDMMRRATEWRNANISAWAEMAAIAESAAAAGRRFSIDQLAIEARYKMRTEGADQGFKVNNTLRAPLARILIKERPHLAPYIETRSSKADWA